MGLMGSGAFIGLREFAIFSIIFRRVLTDS